MTRLISKTTRATLLASLLLCAGSTFAAGPNVTIVVRPDAPKLEQYAAKELSAQLKSLFDAKVSISAEPSNADNVILLSGGWPGLSEQGHLVLSTQRNGKPMLLLGGGSPAAALWAVYELRHHFGVRSLLHADFPPIKRPSFALEGINIRREPNLNIRAWRVMAPSLAGPESWSLADHKLRLKQLAKLKFNRVVLSLHPSQPFVHFKYGGISKQTGALWHGQTFRVDGETAGRAAFGRDRVFQNPDFKGATTYEARVKAGVKLVTGIIDAAQALGMTVALDVDGDEFPDEFASLLPRHRAALRKAQLDAYKQTYPKADAWTTMSPNRSSALTTARGSGASHPQSDLTELLFLGSPTGGVLPEFNNQQLHRTILRIRGARMEGFTAASWLPDDLNSSAYYLSRAAFNRKMTQAKALDGLVTPICGPDVGARIAIGFQHIADASSSIVENGANIATLTPNVVMQHYASNAPVPEWWATTKTSFAEAMNEMYRGNTRARGGARAFSLYHAKRFEFALHYFTCLEETRQAGIAKAAKDKDAQLDHLDKAVEAMHNALGAMADVDRNNGDRGIIAALNEYGFRPLLKELEQAER
ncbi:MAG: hypothetical protein ACI9VS_001603 [Candidatus Binatia bacterium]|jgi:hypothetical protein